MMKAAAPGATKKKQVPAHNVKTRSAKEKKERIWGKTPQKPYISSSIGDMTRVMMRYACMDNTYFYNTEPPPVEFYDYWQKFTVETSKLPNEYVDKKRASIANIKKNTSSFDFFNNYTVPIRSRQNLNDVPKQKKKNVTVDARRISDIWPNVRISMSTESFISSSTKISENASAVDMEVGWDEACSEDYQSSESDMGLDVQDQCRHHRHLQHLQWAQGLDALLHPPEVRKKSSLELTAQGLMDKQTQALSDEILELQKKDNRIIYELATIPRDMDIIDHFAEDMDDSFLLDSYSYSDLPDEAFGPDFDFLNEAVMRKQKRKKEKKQKQQKQGGESKKGKPKKTDGTEGEVAKDKKQQPSSSDSCDESVDELCQVKKPASKKKRRSRGTQKTKSEMDDSTFMEGGYDECIDRRKRRIEDVLRAAVRCRSPMGSFRPKPGEEPLSRYKEQASPGPAAYNPSLTATQPNIPVAFLVPRWAKDIYETPGPGPCANIPENKCTCEMITLHETPRFPEVETLGPGPACVNLSNYHGTAKDKPAATLVGRKSKCCPMSDVQFTNICGWTRYGKAHPPNPVIMSRHELRDKGAPGPKYDIKDPSNRRIGIKIKSRIPEIGDNDQPPPFYYPTSAFGSAPRAVLGIREFMQRKDQSPGPIYNLPREQGPGISLTFKPFPMKGSEQEPSPVEWGTIPGKQKIKVLPRAPEHVIVGRWVTYNRRPTPGPADYDICHECIEECIEAGATLSGRYPTKVETQPGPADYRPKCVWEKSPNAVFTTKKPEKIKPTDERQYGYPPIPKIVGGGLITSRYNSNKETDEKGSKGGEFVDVSGFTNRGKKGGIPISLKSRHTPFKYSTMANPKMVPYDNSDCHQTKATNTTKPARSVTNCKKSTTSCKARIQ